MTCRASTSTSAKETSRIDLNQLVRALVPVVQSYFFEGSDDFDHLDKAFDSDAFKTQRKHLDNVLKWPNSDNNDDFKVSEESTDDIDLSKCTLLNTQYVGYSQFPMQVFSCTELMVSTLNQVEYGVVYSTSRQTKAPCKI